jgi:hypothetical protein
MVSGVTMVAFWSVGQRPSATPFAASGETQATLAELFPEHAILLEEVVDGRGLLAVDPAGNGGE